MTGPEYWRPPTTWAYGARFYLLGPGTDRVAQYAVCRDSVKKWDIEGGKGEWDCAIEGSN